MGGADQRLTSGVAGLLLSLALGACERVDWPFLTTGPPATAAEQSAPSETAAGGASSAKNGAPAAEAPEAESAPGRAETAALPPEPAVDDNPARLIGLDPARLGALLGDPQLIRREPPAEIWQYRGPTCIFDVFLYEGSGGPRVTYLEARDGTAQKTATRACLNELLRARLNRPLSY